MSDKYPGGFVTVGAPAGFSVAFDGTGDYLAVTTVNTAMQLAAGNFTIEFWANFNTSSGTQVLHSYGLEGSPNYSYEIYYTASTLHWNYSTTGSNLFDISFGAFTPVQGTWYHIALVRNSSTVTLYVNGVALPTTQNIGTDVIYYPGTSGAFRIGTQASDYFNGYISNFRLVKGTALYTSTFTPPTQLFPITNTSLLTCQSPTIIDNSTNNFTITANGNAAVSNFTPFPAYTGFNPALGAAAGGVWTLDEAAYYQQNRLWPIYDPYFKNTTLMLHGNGTNAAQNNTFLDSSANNFTITRNGNSTQGSFSPFSQTGWSVNFTGAQTSPSLSFPSNAAYSLGSVSDFTVEFWVYFNVMGAEMSLVERADGSGGPGWTMDKGSADYFWYSNGSTTYTGSTKAQAGRWYHVCAMRANSSIYLFVNGVLDITPVAMANTGDGTTPLSLGERDGGQTFALNGYLSNVRIVKGTAVYPTNGFAVPTSPLTAITNTTFLGCQSNRFVDNSAINATATVGSASSIQAFSPFVPAYITPTTYSNYFNGSSSYLYVVSSALNVPLSTDFTIEGWVYLNAHTNNQPCIFNNYTSSGGLALFAGHNSFDANLFNLLIAGNIYSGGTIVYGKWTHFAVVRNGTGSGNVSLYINGISVLSTISTNAAITYIGQVSIGTAGDSTAAGAINGCISNFRWNTTTAVYTASFTPPTAPLTAISGTQLLTCQSSTFIDNSTNNLTLTAAGTVKTVASPTPFLANVDTTTLNSAYSTRLIGGAAYFDGSGDYLTVASNTAFSWGTGDFSMETWFYSQTSGLLRLFDSDSAPGFLFFQNVNYTFGFYGGNSTFYESANNAITPNAWNHLVVTGVGGTLRLFVNGVLVLYSAAGGSSTASARTCGINGTGTQPATGYMANVRLVKGGIPTLYSTTSTTVGAGVFVPPITPFTGSEALTGGAVSLLTNFTNGAIFDNTAKNVLETIGNAQISTTQSKWGNGSIYFDGTGDRLYISPSTSQSVVLGTGDFTIELWIYFSALPAGDLLLVGGDTNAAYLIATSSGQLRFGTYNVNWIIGPGGTMTTGTWYHVAVSRSGTTVNLFLNGVPVVASVSSSQNFSAASYVIGGDQVGGTTALNGYMDDIRITKACRYFGTFTPPTSQLQDQ